MATCFSLISEYFFEGEGLCRTEGLEVVCIKVLDVAQDAVDIFPVLYPFLLCCLHIVECESLRYLEDLL